MLTFEFWDYSLEEGDFLVEGESRALEEGKDWEDESLDTRA